MIGTWRLYSSHVPVLIIAKRVPFNDIYAGIAIRFFTHTPTRCTWDTSWHRIELDREADVPRRYWENPDYPGMKWSGALLTAPPCFLHISESNAGPLERPCHLPVNFEQAILGQLDRFMKPLE